MKRGGMLLAALLFVGGMLRIGVSAPAPAKSGQETIRLAAKPALRTSSISPQRPVVRTGFQADIERTIRESFGTAEAENQTTDELTGYWGVPANARSHSVQVIAIFPDPVHTQLALFFDRSIESLQIAAQKQGYEFDRAVLPWERDTHPDSPDADVRAKTEKESAEREKNPGLLIFREGFARKRSRINAAIERFAQQHPNEDSSTAAKQAAQEDAPLFVWIASETPTSGLRKSQFERARAAAIAIHSPDADSPTPLLILGPSFSGSLSSLRFELAKEPATPSFIYSGTVTGSSAKEFAVALAGHGQFASFSENDDYLLAQFLEFAFSRGYSPEDVAVLSEDETAYGNIVSGSSSATGSKVSAQNSGGQDPSAATACVRPACAEHLTAGDYERTLHLHFPREISQFRAAYQRQASSSEQQKSGVPAAPGLSALPLDLGETGTNDDTVAPFAPSQSTLSQEAVMLGIVSSLQKHHSKFVVLFATDPLDELFLARYLRESYPQGRIVVATPDLLSAREEDSLLHGIIGINPYPLLPGLNDRLNRSQEAVSSSHEDRIFDSSLSEGTFNAMVGLLSAAALSPTERPVYFAQNSPIPAGPYFDYGSPTLRDEEKKLHYRLRPLLWITLLGRDGFWPLVGITPEELSDANSELPVAAFLPHDNSTTTLKEISAKNVPPDPEPMHTPGAWRIAYYLCVLIMLVHAIFSARGTVFSDSEGMAQFARATPPDRAKEQGENRGALILAAGALCLCAAFVLVICTRTLLGSWNGGAFWTFILWLPLPLFTLATARDLYRWRHARKAAVIFVVFVAAITCVQILLVTAPTDFLRYHRVYWSTRVMHFGSGVSPVLPVLLLAAAFYWWFWMSLRGVSLVDLRRPRLPKSSDLPDDAFRISDAEGERLRKTAYPLSVSPWQIAPLIALAAVFFTVLDYGHPLQTIEGRAYDWGFTVLLAVLTWIFLATLLKLVRTWLETQQILSGLDRKTIREAFSRLKGFSWKPIWNPGGSTLRESYRVLSRALENLERLHLELHSGVRGECLATDDLIHGSILAALEKRDELSASYKKLMTSPALSGVRQNAAAHWWNLARIKKLRWRALLFLKHDQKRQNELDGILIGVEDLQLAIAKVAGVLMRDYLDDQWRFSSSLVASEDPREKKELLSLARLLAEEYVCLVFVNFLVSALLRMRTLVYCAVGMYVLLMCSVSVYPFEPHPALQTCSIIALVILGFVIGYVYSQMHRNEILSRLTETSAGELGWDFWIKFVSAGAIPVFTLLAAQFPSVNNIFFSWLEPALQALK